ncbi:MAG: hypothetical protein K6347_05580 [Campylobacterales bacterium]
MHQNEGWEPTNQASDDYETMSSSKKRTVWMVVLAVIVMGSIIAIFKIISNVPDSLPVETNIQHY